jgi:hypothetical protein
VIRAVLLETYLRPGGDFDYGFGVYAEQTFRRRFTLGGGYARVDRGGLNSDRFPQGKRLHLECLFEINQKFSLNSTVTQSVGKTPAGLPRTRFEIGFHYNLLESLRKTTAF